MELPTNAAAASRWKIIRPLVKKPLWKTTTKAYDWTAWINLADTVEEFTTDKPINVGAYIFTHRPLSRDNFADCEKMRKYKITEELVILLVEPNDRCRFSIPKGHLKINELPHAGAMREIEYETGMRVTIDETTPRITYSMFKENIMQIHYLVYVPWSKVPAHLTPIDTVEIRFAFWATANFITENITYCNYTLTHHGNLNPLIRLAFEFDNCAPGKHDETFKFKFSSETFTLGQLAHLLIEAHIVSLHNVVARCKNFTW